MNLTQNMPLYRIFYAVAVEGNISRAAQTLYISQPATSKAIRRLENALGTPLFFRSSRGVSLTEEGQLLFQRVSSAFEQISQAEDELQQIRQLGIGTLSIGASSTLCKFVLLPYLQSFIARYPHIRITIQCHSSNHTLQLLKDKKTDLGLVGKPDTLNGLCFNSLGEIHDIFVASPSYLDNLKTRFPRAAPDFFRSATLMLLDRENMTRQYLDDYFARQRIKPEHLLEVTNLELLIEFARIGLGAAAVIREFVLEDLAAGTLVEIPLEVPLPRREIGFISLPASARTDAVNRFLSCVSTFPANVLHGK